MSNNLSVLPISTSTALIPYESAESVIAKVHRTKKPLPSTTWQIDPKTDKISRIKTKVIDGKEVTSTTKYKMGKRLGAGFGGEVFRFEPEVDGKAKAVKILYGATLGFYMSLKREYDISLQWPDKTAGLQLRPKARLRNNNIDVLIMHEYNAKLDNIVSSLTPEEILNAICQISSGLAELHKRNIVHADVKMENILYDSKKNRYDLIDLGLSKSITKSKSEWADVVGSIDIGKNTDLDKLQYVIEGIFYGHKQPYGDYKEYIPEIGYLPAVNELILRAMASIHLGADVCCKLFEMAREEFQSPLLS